MSATNTLYTALLAAQRAMGPVKKDASNPAFRTKYATLQSVLETVEGPLSDNGLVLVQRFEVGESYPILWTQIIHAATGDAISSAVAVVSKDPTDPQKVGGAITYYRRYSLLALLGLAPEDDDANAAAKPTPQPTSAAQSNGSAPTRAPQPPTPQRPPQPPTPALAPDDPLAAAVAKLRAMETEGKPWDAIKKYAEEQWELADDYGKEIINSTAKAIKVRRKVAAPVAPAHEVS